MKQPINSNGISYHSDLTKGLIDEHKVLLTLFGKMTECVDSGDIVAFKKELKEFKATLTSHLLTEAVKLYIYLKQKLKDDEAVYELVVSYKREMDTVGRAVMKFLEECTLKDNQDFNLIDLKKQLNAIGGTLIDRIQREESQLYPLYHDDYF